MIGAAIRGRRLLRNVIIAGVLAGAGLLSAQAIAAAANDLSSVVLAESLPGFVAAPPGIRNGPITQSDLNQVLGTSNPAVSELGDQLAAGNVTGYIRIWTHEPTNGDAVVIIAFQFQTEDDATSFLTGAAGGLQRQAGEAQFAVPGVPGAVGYAMHTTVEGASLAEYVVPFKKGSTYFQVETATESGDVTSAQTAGVAARQWDAAPASPRDWTPIFFGIGSAGGILLSIGIVLVARRRAYPAIFTAPPPPVPVPGQWTPPAPSHVQP